MTKHLRRLRAEYRLFRQMGYSRFGAAVAAWRFYRIDRATSAERMLRANLALIRDMRRSEFEAIGPADTALLARATDAHAITLAGPDGLRIGEQA